MLGEAVELTHPNHNYPLCLFTDASDDSIGKSLQMLSPAGTFQPLGFYSAHLNPSQKKYSMFKKELLGATLRHFLPEMYGMVSGGAIHPNSAVYHVYLDSFEFVIDALVPGSSEVG